MRRSNHFHQLNLKRQKMQEVKPTLKPVVKFGVGQIENPTPKAFKYIFRIYSFLAGAWALFAPQFVHLNPDILGEINRWLLVSGTFLHYAIKFFGWDIKEENTQNRNNMNYAHQVNNYADIEQSTMDSATVYAANNGLSEIDGEDGLPNICQIGGSQPAPLQFRDANTMQLYWTVVAPYVGTRPVGR